MHDQSYCFATTLQFHRHLQCGHGPIGHWLCIRTNDTYMNRDLQMIVMHDDPFHQAQD